VVHLRCGDDVREKLPLAGFVGDFQTFVDPLCQGPVPDEPDEERFLAVRADFVARAYDFPVEEVRQRLRDEWVALDRLAGYDRIVLWFEHDWFDQAILIRVLAALAENPAVSGRLRLMSINSFDGVTPFFGFGQLTSEQLATLTGRDEPVTDAQFALAQSAWAALRSPSALPLQELVDELGSDRDAALPFLGAAIGRHLRDLPWRGDGLGLSERLCLRAVASGRHTLHEIFPSVHAADPHPYLGDLQLVTILEGLTTGAQPALTGRDGGWTLTEQGGELLAGSATWSGTERWIGGVRLSGDRPAWLWDPDTARVVGRG
jgi:hypothetical protein